MSNEDTKTFVSAKKLCELFPDFFTIPTLERWRSEGKGPPYIKVGPRRVAYRLCDIEAWLDNRVVTSVTDARERGIAS